MPSTSQNRGFVATIGSFDGVHLGHRHVIRQVEELAHQLGLSSMVVSFPNHPLKVLRPDFHPELLTLADEKEALLRDLGADSVVMLPFTRDLSMLTSREFMDRILREQLGVKVLVIGYDNHFGHDRRSFDDYVAYGKELGIEVVRGTQTETAGLVPSSTAIRQALKSGDVELANSLLGYAYRIDGEVVSGFHVGTTIGYPTANISVDADKLLPRGGAYCVRCLDHVGMMNIGHRPTLDNGSEQSIEIHLLDFEGNLYDRQLQVELLSFLREERKFGSLEELKQQLHHDEEACRKLCEGIVEV